ncbi:MAG: hypothetical protein EP330_10390 [Deltaproteobacteria bacterium]|nr:MAG: hypothetical protein EP330_10390 [Deltaproteobacteria bacterium]
MSALRERLAKFADRAEALWQGRAVPAALLAVVAAVYSWAYWTHKELPTAGAFPDRSGWWGRVDPYKYQLQAEAISRWALDGDTHHYPIGYALSAAPFAWIDPQHAFFVPNLAFVTVASGFLYALARKLVRPVEAALVVGLAAWATLDLLELALIIPRSTIATLPLAYAMLALFVWRKPSLALVFQLVAIEGLVYLTRPGDAVYLAGLLVLAVLQLPTWKERVLGGTLGPALLSLFLLANRTLNQSMVKAATSAYEQKHARGFTTGRLFETFYTTFLDGAPIYRAEHVALLWRMPWLLLVAAGLVWAVRREGWRQAVVVGTAAVGLLFYLLYWNTCPVSLWDFHLVRYTAWAYPLLFVYAWVAARFAVWQVDKRLVAGLTLVPALYCWTLRLEEADRLPVTVQEDGTLVAGGAEDPGGYDLIVLHEPLSDGSAVVYVDGERLQNQRDMHKRRTAHHETTLRGTVLFLHDKVGVDQLTLRPELAGTDVELRRLERRFVLLPPVVHKWWSGDRLWGVDTFERTAVAGTYRDSTFQVHESEEGVVVEASFFDVGQGRYRVRVTGQLVHTVRGHATVYFDGFVAKDRDVTFEQRMGNVFSTRFKVPETVGELRIRAEIPEGATILGLILEPVPLY